MVQKALIMVDLQKDFCQNGSLAVPAADEVIPLANELQKVFKINIATQDWHPASHLSFASNQPGHRVGDVIRLNDVDQILWPDHCVQNTEGAELHSDLLRSSICKIIYKGTDKSVDSYSAFFDNARKVATELDQYLKNQNVEEVYIMGLATDYCVKYTCLDAKQLGYQVFLIEDACRGVNLSPNDVAQALKELKQKGVKLIDSESLFR